MSRAEPLRNSEEDLNAFFTTCERLAGFDAALTPFFVEGWFTAMVMGPVRPPDEQWIELLFGDVFDRTFADPPDRERALATLQTRLIALTDMLDAEALLERPDFLRLDPIIDEWSDEDRKQMVERGLPEAHAGEMLSGELWAEGLLVGVDALRDEVWRLRLDDAADHEFCGLMSQIEALTLDPQGEAWREFGRVFHDGKQPERDRVLDDAAFAVQDLRLLLLEFGPRPPMRRVEAKPGRNDPCPCGSGKKYKKCHGAVQAQ